MAEKTTGFSSIVFLTQTLTRPICLSVQTCVSVSCTVAGGGDSIPVHDWLVDVVLSRTNRVRARITTRVFGGSEGGVVTPPVHNRIPYRMLRGYPVKLLDWMRTVCGVHTFDGIRIGLLSGTAPPFEGPLQLLYKMFVLVRCYCTVVFRRVYYVQCSLSARHVRMPRCAPFDSQVEK